MPAKKERWSLAELIDFETALASVDGKVARRRADGGSRPQVMREWLMERQVDGPGRRWVNTKSKSCRSSGFRKRTFKA